MVQPFDYMHKPGKRGLNVWSFAKRYDIGSGPPDFGFLLAQPFATGDLDFHFARMGIRVSGAAATTVNIGIYDTVSSRNLYPNNLVADLGSISYSVTGEVFTQPLPTTLLANGLYWIATLWSGSSGSHSSMGSNNEEGIPGYLGSILPSGNNPPTSIAVGWRVPYSFGSLPAVFPAGAVGASNVGAIFPAILIDPETPPLPPPVIGGLATGGTVNDVVIGGNTWRIHTFTASGTFVVTQQIPYCQCLLVGGGGGGGSSQSTSSWASGGGGGGGSVVSIPYPGFLSVAPGNYPVVVGVGGAGGLPNTNTGSPGSASTWNGQTAPGGGPGGAYQFHSGGSSEYAGGPGGTGPAYGGGGGGGAGAVGGAGSGSAGGAGGAGLVSNITGTSVHYGGGGGGGIYSGTSNGAGGVGGGGAGGIGGVPNANGSNGVNGLGGGGGGASTQSGSKAGATSVGGKGGDGIVIIRYPIA